MKKVSKMATNSSIEKSGVTRRIFNKIALSVGVLAGFFAMGKGASSFLTTDEKFLRLPGALSEKQLLGLCIKCGQCVQVCPYNSVTLLDINKGLNSGTPVITPRERGCYLCDLLPCVLSCPSGALSHKVSSPVDVKMGIAAVEYPDRCFGKTGESVSENQIMKLIAHGAKTIEEKELAEKLKNFINKPCTICRDMCPYPDRDEAIEIATEGDGYIPVIKSKCVGCGVCAELCPAEGGVFRIDAV